MLDGCWKSSLSCFSFLFPLLRWWMLWRLTPLHVALSCTTSLSRSLLSWRTTSMSAAAKLEPASLFCSPSFSPPASCLPPAYVVAWDCRWGVTVHECHSHRLLLRWIAAEQRILTCLWSAIHSTYDTNTIQDWPNNTSEGMCRRSDLFLDFSTVNGTCSKPWWQA